MTECALRLAGICLAFHLCTTGVFGQPATSHTIPGRDVERELLVPVLIRNQGPFWFALDTGIAHTAIDREAVQKAHLELTRKDSKHSSIGPTRLDIGGNEFETSLDVLDIGAAEYQRAEDQPIAGVLGMDFFEKFIVVLDYDAEVVTLHDASLDLPRDGSRAVPITFRDSLPYVYATMKLPGHAPVRQSFLLDTSTGDAINDDAFGHLGHATIGPDLGRAEYFRIGPYRFTGVNGTSGPSKVGGELLHRFLVTIDIPHGRIFLAPSRYYGDAFLFDTSGLDLERSDNGLKVLRVFPRTPGQEAGLTAGDAILSIDGQPTSAFTVRQVRLMFHEVGRHTLLIESQGVRKIVELKLRTLL